jgi:hypothetical protein
MAIVHLIPGPFPTSARFKNLTGLAFGSWRVEEFAGRDSRGGIYWRCRCACGSVKPVLSTTLTRGVSKGCQSCSLRTHGHSYVGRKSRTYRCWESMIERCTNPGRNQYADYGGRGITVCDRWRQSFAAFLADMGEKPVGGYSIDRIDNNRGYEPNKSSGHIQRTHPVRGGMGGSNRIVPRRHPPPAGARMADRIGIDSTETRTQLIRKASSPYPPR